MKKILFIFWLIIIVIAGWYFFTHDISIEIIQDWIKSFGIWAVLIFIIAYTIRPLVFFPTSIMTPAAVVLFGPLAGWFIAYVGENFSANFAFLVARFFGRKFVCEHKNKFLKKYDKKLSHCGFETIIFLRLVPLFPFDFVNYTSGLSSVRHRDYFLATLLGTIPGLTAYILLGASFATNPKFILPTIIAFGLLAGMARLLKKKMENVNF